MLSQSQAGIRNSLPARLPSNQRCVAKTHPGELFQQLKGRFYILGRGQERDNTHFRATLLTAQLFHFLQVANLSRARGRIVFFTMTRATHARRPVLKGDPGVIGMPARHAVRFGEVFPVPAAIVVSCPLSIDKTGDHAGKPHSR